MKPKTLFFALAAILIASCSNEVDEFVDNSSERINEETQLTRAAVSDSTDLGELQQYFPTAEMLQENELYQYSKPRKAAAYSTNYDDYFYTNIIAISELPVTIAVRSVADGSTAANKFFYCAAAQKEVTLSASSAAANKFYIKVMPATTGIPYMIYSNASKTPLCIGCYSYIMWDNNKVDYNQGHA